jgi:hypothetical protein
MPAGTILFRRNNQVQVEAIQCLDDIGTPVVVICDTEGRISQNVLVDLVGGVSSPNPEFPNGRYAFAYRDECEVEYFLSIKELAQWTVSKLPRLTTAWDRLAHENTDDLTDKESDWHEYRCQDLSDELEICERLDVLLNGLAAVGRRGEAFTC